MIREISLRSEAHGQTNVSFRHPTYNLCNSYCSDHSDIIQRSGALCYAYVGAVNNHKKTKEDKICITWILVIYILNIVSVTISKFHTTTIRETMFE